MPQIESQGTMRAEHTLAPGNPMLRTTLGAVLISFSGVWVKLAHVTPTVSAFYRVLFGGIILLSILVFRRQKLWPERRGLGLCLLAGLIFALDLYTWHRSIVLVGPGLATLLGNFEVFLVPVAGVLLYGERLRLRFVCSVPLAVVGLFLVVGVNWELLSPDYRTGIIYGLTTAIFYAGFLITLRQLQSRAKEPSAALNLMVVSFTTALCLIPEMLRTGESFAIPDLQTGAALAALGLLSQTLGWLLIGRSLPRIPASIASLLLLLQPALAFIWDVILFGRKTGLPAWAGVALTLSAIYVGATSEQKETRRAD